MPKSFGQHCTCTLRQKKYVHVCVGTVPKVDSLASTSTYQLNHFFVLNDVAFVNKYDQVLDSELKRKRRRKRT